MRLVYWDVRGYAESARYILRYSETEYTDERMTASAERFVQWMGEKYTLGLGLPNLPYLIDGDIKLSQSLAIVRYLGRKFGLVAGDNEQDITRVEMVEQEMTDFKNAFGKICYDPQFEDKKPAYLESLAKKISTFDGYLGAGPFVLGDKLTYVDFLVYEFFSQINKLAPEEVAKGPNIVNHRDNFERLPTLQGWFESEEAKVPRYINSPMCSFPGK